MKIRLKQAPVSTEKYLMVGISTSLKDFQLVHYLNKQFDTKFCKIQDIIFYDKNGSLGEFPFYYHRNSDLKIDYYIFSNRSDKNILLSKYRNFEFIVLFEVSSYAIPLKDILREMRHIKNLSAALEIPLNTIKNLGAILEDIELHLLDVSSNKKKSELNHWLW